MFFSPPPPPPPPPLSPPPQRWRWRLLLLKLLLLKQEGSGMQLVLKGAGEWGRTIVRRDACRTGMLALMYVRGWAEWKGVVCAGTVTERWGGWTGWIGRRGGCIISWVCCKTDCAVYKSGSYGYRDAREVFFFLCFFREVYSYRDAREWIHLPHLSATNVFYVS
jgi:hypothetical protein